MIHIDRNVLYEPDGEYRVRIRARTLGWWGYSLDADVDLGRTSEHIAREWAKYVVACCKQGRSDRLGIGAPDGKLRDWEVTLERKTA